MARFNHLHSLPQFSRDHAPVYEQSTPTYLFRRKPASPMISLICQKTYENFRQKKNFVGEIKKK